MIKIDNTEELSDHLIEDLKEHQKKDNQISSLIKPCFSEEEKR